MKKILLSVIALFAAVSMNAKQDVDISAIGALNTPIKFAGTWEWKGQVISTGDIVRDDAAGTCDDSGVTYFDGSEYDYLFFKYTSTSDKLKCIIQYNTTGVIGEWGPNFNESTKELKASENMAFVPLTEFKNTISQVAFQDMGEALELTITEIWFGTKDEVKAAMGGGSSEGGEEGGSEGGSESGEFTYAVFNVDNALGLDKENGTSLTAGTELFNEEEGVLTIGADDTYKPQEVAFAVNDKEAVKGGLQGATNPKDADGTICSETLKEPAAGAFFTFEAKKDGFLYVIHKASANKAYTVFEEGTAIGYKFAAVGDAATDLGAIYQFELKGEGELNEVKEKVLFAEQLFLQGTDKYDSHLDADGKWVVIKNAEDKAISGLGVIVFPVFADCKYKFNANGSKMTLAGIAFSDADDLTIKTDDGVEIYNGGGATAIQGAKVVTVAGNSAIYNLAGQKVNASYKGIVIKDGKKYIQK